VSSAPENTTQEASIVPDDNDDNDDDDDDDDDEYSQEPEEAQGSQNESSSNSNRLDRSRREAEPVRINRRPSTAIGSRASSTAGTINFSKLKKTLEDKKEPPRAQRPQTAIGTRTPVSSKKFMTKRDIGNLMRQKKVGAAPLWELSFQEDVDSNVIPVKKAVLDKAETHSEYNVVKKKVRPQTAFPNSLRPKIAQVRAHQESPKILTLEKDVREAPAPAGQRNGSQYLFHMPRPTPEPFDDGEKMPEPEPRYQNGDCRIKRTEISLFHEESKSCAKDYSYKDTFKRSLSSLDSRYVGPTNKKYPKKPGPYNVPTHGTRLNQAYQLSEFRMLDRPLDLLSPLDSYKGVKDPWCELPRFD